MNWTLLQNSLLVAGITTVLASFFGFFVALWAQSMGAQGRRALIVCAVLTLALPAFLVVNSWLHLFGNTGSFKNWLPFDLYSLTGTVTILTTLMWPISMLGCLAAWRQIQPSHLESDPCMSGWILVRHLAWPLARPALLQAAAIIFVLALNHFAIPAILQVKVLPASMWVGFSTNFNYREALFTALPLILAGMVLLAVIRTRPTEWPFVEGMVPASQFRRQLGPNWCRVCGALCCFVIGLSVGLPLLDLFATPRSWTEFASAFAAGQQAALNSLLYSATAASLILVIGLSTWRWRAGALFWITFLVPGIFLGVLLTFTLNRPGMGAITQSAAIVFIALTLRYAGPGWSGIAQIARGLDRDLDDAARLEGASSWQRLFRIHAPQLAPALAAVWYVTYLLCLWDTETLLLILPPAGETLAVRIFNLLHYGHNTQVNALCLALLALAVLPLGIWTIGSWIKSRAADSTPLGLAAVTLAGMLLTGCGGTDDPSRASLSSAVFSEARIIGTRGTGPGQFNKPRSVALDRNDNLYVVDMTGRVQKFSPEGQYLLSWQMPQTEKGKPKGMGMDRDGNILVVEPHYTCVNHFNLEGKLVRQWGNNGTNTGELAFPRAIATTAKGDLYISEYSLVERVQLFTPDGTKCLRVITNGFDRAEGIGVDSQDHLYVADSCNHVVKVFDATGKSLGSFGGAGSATGKLSYPYDVRVDSAGRIYVCEFGNSRIQIFDAGFKPIEVLGGIGGQPGQFSNPWSIALDSKGNLYVADANNHRVQKLIAKTKLAAN